MIHSQSVIAALKAKNDDCVMGKIARKVESSSKLPLIWLLGMICIYFLWFVAISYMGGL